MGNRQNVDVAVIGGGPAGSSTAMILRRNGHSVVMIERSRYESVRTGEILPPIIKNLLADLDVYDRFLSDKHSPSLGICSAWGQPDLYEHDFIFNPYNVGWHVDRRRFDTMLARASEEVGVRLHLGARLVSCVLVKEEGWDLEIMCNGNHHKYHCKFLVDATGRTSTMAIKQGSKRICYDQLIGVVGYLSPSSKTIDKKYMLLEAFEDGWWYSATLPDHRLVVVYMTDADLYSMGIKTSTSYFWVQLQRTIHTKSRVNLYSLKSDLRVLSTNSSRMDKVTGKHWLAVGDAAMAFDPLSSQGVYKALKSGLRAAQSIKEYLIGKETALLDYSSWIDESFDNYLLLRKEFYSREGRWPNSKFWQRRH